MTFLEPGGEPLSGERRRGAHRRYPTVGSPTRSNPLSSSFGIARLEPSSDSTGGFIQTKASLPVSASTCGPHYGSGRRRAYEYLLAAERLCGSWVRAGAEVCGHVQRRRAHANR